MICMECIYVYFVIWGVFLYYGSVNDLMVFDLSNLWFGKFVMV